MMKKHLFRTVSLSTGRNALHHVPCASQRLLSYHRIFATRGWMSSGGVGKAACVWFIISLTQKSQREPNWLVGCPTQLICIFISIWAGPFQEFLIWAGPFREFSIWCWPIQKNFWENVIFLACFPLLCVSFGPLTLLYSDDMHVLQKDWFKTFIPAWNRSLNIVLPPVWSRHRLLNKWKSKYR